MIAFGVRPAAFAVAIAPAIPFASILNVVSSTSTNTGVAPTSAATSAGAQNVNDGQSTASPGPIPKARKTSTSASVPLAQLTTSREPQNAASSVSKARTSGPRINWQWLNTRATAASTAEPSRRRWAATSMKGIGGGLVRRFIECPDGPLVSPRRRAGLFVARGQLSWNVVQGSASRSQGSLQPLRL